jgi:hypothetical protein
MKFLTSTAAVLLFVVGGVAQMDFIIWFGIVAFIGSVVGQVILQYIVQKTERPSILVFVVVFVVFCSGCNFLIFIF